MLQSFEKFGVLACHDVSTGGVAVALAEMAFAGRIGFEVELKDYVELFSESNTRWVVEVAERQAEEFVEFMGSNGLSARVIGNTGGDELNFGAVRLDFERAENAWRTGMSRYVG